MARTKRILKMNVKFEPSRIKHMHFEDAYSKFIPVNKRKVNVTNGESPEKGNVFSNDKRSKI